MSDRTRGVVAVIFASLCLSTLPAAVKLGLGDAATPVQLLAPRMALGCALLWIYVGITRPHRIRIDAAGLRSCALAGVVNGLSLTLFYLALQRIDAGVAIVVFAAYPVLLLAMLRLRGEPITRLDGARLALAFGGIALVSELRTDALDGGGLMLALGCAVVYTVYIMIVHSRLATYPASTSAVWIVTFFCLTVLAARLLTAPQQPLGSTAWAVAIWSAIVGTALARVAMLEGIRLLGGAQTALLMPVEVVFSVVWAALLLGERLSAMQLGGGVLVVASVALAPLSKLGRARWRRYVPR